MGELRGNFDVRQLAATSPDGLQALHLAMGIRWTARVRPARQVADTLAHAERHQMPIDLLFGAHTGHKLVSAAVAVESPGHAALVFAPTAGATEAALAALEAMTKAAWRRSLCLLQILVDPESADPTSILAPAGFHYLTRLVYLTRRVSLGIPDSAASRDLEWVPYSSAGAARFHEALELTYAQSLDCPELMGLRTTADVLAGHRASGVFAPSLWWLATRADTPVGVLLLSRIPRCRALEIVYMGVGRSSRGTGVGDALLRRALATAKQVNVKSLALAVDQRNTPARNMYARWNFTQTATRDAWIASPRGIIG